MTVVDSADSGLAGDQSGTDGRTSLFYKAVVQSVLLYGSEMWTITRPILKALEGSHHRVARKLTGLGLSYLPAEDRWHYPPIEEALERAGMFTMEHYLSVRLNMLVVNVATRPILKLCQDAGRLSGSPGRQYWWHRLE